MVADMSLLRDARIAIATPHQGSMTHQYVASLFETQRRMATAGCKVSLMLQSSINVEVCRNLIVSSFLANVKSTHLMFIDSDHGWRPEYIARLLMMQKDVIGVVARKKIPDRIEWAANFATGRTLIDETGAMKLNGEIGTGFLMITRTALQRMIKAYPEMKARHPYENATSLERQNYYRLFQFEVDDDGIQRSEDITFCRRWTAIGGEVWCDPTADIIHVGSYEYSGAVSSMVVEERNE